MTDETTSEQLAEIEGQGDTVQVREGRWKTRSGDIRNVTPTPAYDSRAKRWPWRDAKYDQTYREDGGYHIIGESPSDLVEYLGPIQPDKTQELPDKTQELETKTQELPEYTPPEGWRVVRFGEELLPGDVWVNEDGTEHRSNILQWDASAVSGGRCIRRIEPQPQPEVEPNAATIEELRSEVSYVQRVLGESRQRVTQLEELVASLRNINEAQEKTVEAAGKENSALRNQLEAVKAELVTQAETSRRLQIELDAAQQVPADSPELRQLRADLAEVAHDRDSYKHAHELLLNDANTVHERTKAMTVEAIAEWLDPVQAAIAAADNVAESTRAGWLAEEVIQHLPKIMRSLVGLDSPEDVD